MVEENAGEREKALRTAPDVLSHCAIQGEDSTGLDIVRKVASAHSLGTF